MVAIEKEAKLAAWPGFVLPPLHGCVPGLEIETDAPWVFDARYFDGPDLRLMRAGITLRHRAGEGGPEGTWTLKVDRGPADGVAQREELVVAGPLGEVPSDFRARVRPWLRTAPLEMVAHLRTQRGRTRLVRNGSTVAEVDDDEVSVLVGEHVAARFREVEVESDDEVVRDAVVHALRNAGAGAPDPTPKVVRALGPRARRPPDLAPLAVDRGSSAGDVLRAGIVAAALRIVEHDPVIRADVDPEGVHQARVGCRRLRSDLRTFRPLVDREWAEPLRAELRWLAGELGAVRDLDVLDHRLARQVTELPPADRPGAQRLREHLRSLRRDAVDAAVAALDSDRYLQLLDRLVEAASSPPTTAKADRDATQVLPKLARGAYDRLAAHVERLPSHPSDEALHDLRIQAKKARYAADVAVPVIGKQAQRYTKVLGRLQDVLGDLHDCAVAEASLRSFAAEVDLGAAFAAGALAELQRVEAQELRHRWPAAWAALHDDDLTEWMT